MSWDHGNPAKCVEAIHKAKDGDIVLMHDFQEADVLALPEILDYLEEENLLLRAFLNYWELNLMMKLIFIIHVISERKQVLVEVELIGQMERVKNGDR